jgi:hypothetical protein
MLENVQEYRFTGSLDEFQPLQTVLSPAKSRKKPL